MADIILTWPKGRTLESYVTALGEAFRNDELINFRVSNLPKDAYEYDRVYMVHDGHVRGYNWLHSFALRGENEVKDPITGAFWPEGKYIVRHPGWKAITPIPMKGFQGWRYADKHFKREDVTGIWETTKPGLGNR